MKALQKLRQLVRGTLDRVVRHPKSPVIEIEGMKYSRKYGLELQAKHPSVIALAAHLAQFFKDQGGINYVEFSAWTKDLGELTFTVQRRDGETPAMQAARWKRMYEELKSNPAGQGRADCGAYPGTGCSNSEVPK